MVQIETQTSSGLPIGRTWKFELSVIPCNTALPLKSNFPQGLPRATHIDEFRDVLIKPSADETPLVYRLFLTGTGILKEGQTVAI